MKELTPEQIAYAEESMKAHRHEMKKVADFINEPVKDKHGKEKNMSLHMRTDYIACALDELHERVKNSICLHVSQIHAAISDLYKGKERMQLEIDDLCHRIANLEQQIEQTPYVISLRNENNR